MDTTILVSKALEYYDQNKEKYETHFRDVQYIQFIKRDDHHQNYLIILDANIKKK